MAFSGRVEVVFSQFSECLSAQCPLTLNKCVFGAAHSPISECGGGVVLIDSSV